MVKGRIDPSALPNSRCINPISVIMCIADEKPSSLRLSVVSQKILCGQWECDAKTSDYGNIVNTRFIYTLKVVWTTLVGMSRVSNFLATREV
jgi:hypothetical protein